MQARAGSRPSAREEPEHIFTRYVGYVARDPALSQEAKDSEVKLIDATKRAVERLKKRTEE